MNSLAFPHCTVAESHKSTAASFYPFTEGKKSFLKKPREDIGSPSIDFTCTTVVDDTFTYEKLKTYCKTFVQVDASQL